MNKCPKYKFYLSIILIFVLYLLGSIFTLLPKLYANIKLLLDCCQNHLLCIGWVIIILITLYLIKFPVVCVFEIFERMRLSREYTLRILPGIVSCLMGLYLIPLPIFLVYNNCFSSYMNYQTILTSVLALNGFFTFFIAERNLKNDRLTSAQFGGKLSDNNSLRGFRIEKGTSIFENNKKYKIEESILLVADYLGNGSGDNLWFPMNQWHEKFDDKNSDYPIFNARSDNWRGNDEWYRQLNDFANYLKKNNEIKELG